MSETERRTQCQLKEMSVKIANQLRKDCLSYYEAQKVLTDAGFILMNTTLSQPEEDL